MDCRLAAKQGQSYGQVKCEFRFKVMTTKKAKIHLSDA